MKRFNRAILEVDEADDQVQLTAFQVGLTTKDFIFSLAKTPLTTLTNLLFQAQKYMNGEDVLTTKGMDGKWKIDNLDEPWHKKKEKKDHSLDQKVKKGSLNLLKIMVNFTPLKMPMEKKNL